MMSRKTGKNLRENRPHEVCLAARMEGRAGFPPARNGDGPRRCSRRGRRCPALRPLRRARPARWVAVWIPLDGGRKQHSMDGTARLLERLSTPGSSRTCVHVTWAHVTCVREGITGPGERKDYPVSFSRPGPLSPPVHVYTRGGLPRGLEKKPRQSFRRGFPGTDSTRYALLASIVEQGIDALSERGLLSRRRQFPDGSTEYADPLKGLREGLPHGGRPDGYRARDESPAGEGQRT